MQKYWLKFGSVAVISVVALFFLLSSGQSKAQQQNDVPPDASSVATIKTLEAKLLSFVEEVVSDGTINTKNSTLVSPRISGVIDEICVREGNEVVEGKTKLFQIDNKKLIQAVQLSRQALIIEESTRDERLANLEKAKADLLQAERDFQRSEALFQQKVIPRSDYEQSETKVMQMAATSKLSATQVVLAEQSAAKAEISLAMAERDLADSVSTAPINGIISLRNAEPGEMGTPGTPIVRIDDVKDLKAVAYLPGQFFSRVKPNSSKIQLEVEGRVMGVFPITYKSPTIDSSFRTFEIWADVPGDGESVVPGAQCVVRVILRQEDGIGVPIVALQYRRGKYWIFVPSGNHAKIIEVVPGLERDGWTQLVNAPLQVDDKVIVEGQFLLHDGQTIREQGQ